MALYIGVQSGDNEVSKEVKQVYCGINDEAKNVYKVYVGAPGNVPKLVWWGRYRVPVPVVSSTAVYDGNSHSPVVSNLDTSRVTVSGTDTETSAGTYTLTFTLNETVHSVWEDGTTAPKQINWTISKATLARPTASALTYNGSEQNIANNLIGFDSNTMTISNSQGTTKATHPGTYYVYISLNDTSNYKWQGSSSSTIPVMWTISKAAAPTLSWYISSDGWHEGDTISVTGAWAYSLYTECWAVLQPYLEYTDAYTMIRLDDFTTSGGTKSGNSVYTNGTEAVRFATETSSSVRGVRTCHLNLKRMHNDIVHGFYAEGFVYINVYVNTTDYSWSNTYYDSSVGSYYIKKTLRWYVQSAS